MFVPIGSDRPLRTTPYVNYALIAANVLMFAATRQSMESEGGGWIAHLMLWKHASLEGGPVITRLWQFISYQFLHADGWHLIGNMIFLWVFGNPVEDRLGKLGYLFFYLSMGVVAGLGHWLTSDAPVLGASGSVAGVTGAFLALFPRTHIKFFYFWFLIGFFEVPAMVVVLFYFAKDLLFFGLGGGNVAYTAHLAGNLAGFAVAMALLGPRVLPREPYDLFSLWTHKRRRDRFRKITSQGYQAWEGRYDGTGKKPGPAMSPQEQALADQRQQISRAIASHELDEAARLYNGLLSRDAAAVLSQRQQMDIANHLAATGDHAAAARAYELLLKNYPTHPDAGQAQLMLGLIFARYLDRPDQARPLLQEAGQRLQGDESALARQVLTELG